MMNKVAARGLSLSVRNPVKTTRNANFAQNSPIFHQKDTFSRDFHANAAALEKSLAQRESVTKFSYFRNKVIKN